MTVGQKLAGIRGCRGRSQGLVVVVLAKVSCELHACLIKTVSDRSLAADMSFVTSLCANGDSSSSCEWHDATLTIRQKLYVYVLLMSFTVAAHITCGETLLFQNLYFCVVKLRGARNL